VGNLRFLAFEVAIKKFDQEPELEMHLADTADLIRAVMMGILS
jgi:hypothetical protein